MALALTIWSVGSFRNYLRLGPVNTNRLRDAGAQGVRGAMELTEAQCRRIEDGLPRQRGNVSQRNPEVLNALRYVLEQGGKWRGLPRRFGNWHTLSTRG